ncbi:MAG: S-methyl-5'-thioadenosine phosphorylase [Capsulimonadales bacterium]|nr:S-methyl-5'-thioadenosine phosphorylase [Capsulimonadales bacterium]
MDQSSTIADLELPRADIGIFGGTGFYSLLTGDVRQFRIETPYGPPSDQVTIGEIAGKRVAFLPRHGKQHTLPPHRINYRANVFAMKSLGVTDILAPNACGSLQHGIKPGDFVICDQFVDRTRGRADTFYDGPTVTHISSADPYCPILRQHAVTTCRKLDLPVHDGGTVVVVQGPRFSTRAESRWFTDQGWHVINMTQYPECILAREQEISYVNISLITDYDVGLVADAEGVAPVTNQEVVDMFRANLDRLRRLIFGMIETLPDTSESPARNCLAHARFT